MDYIILIMVLAKSTVNGASTQAKHLLASCPSSTTLTIYGFRGGGWLEQKILFTVKLFLLFSDSSASQHF